MVYKMTAIDTLFDRARPVEPINRPAASDKAPACGCLPMLGFKKLYKKVSRTLKSIHHRQEPQHPVKQPTQKTDGVNFDIDVLANGDVKCSLTITVVQPQHKSQPASDDVALAERNCSNLGLKQLTKERQAETDSQGTTCKDELGGVDPDVCCDVVLTDTATLESKSKGISKLAHWCEIALDSSRASSDVCQKKVSRWVGSSSNSRHSSLLRLSGAFVSFRKSNGSSSA